MKVKIVEKDNHIYIALFFNHDNEMIAPIYLAAVEIINQSDFDFLQREGVIEK